MYIYLKLLIPGDESCLQIDKKIIQSLRSLSLQQIAEVIDFFTI